MSKEYKTIGVNTDPLSVQLYFDEKNAIKWKIIFKDTTFIDSNQNQTNTNLLNVQEPINLEHVLTNIFPNIFIIGPKNKYQFKYNEIQLELDEIERPVYEIEYNSFDHLKYNKIISEDLDKKYSMETLFKKYEK